MTTVERPKWECPRRIAVCLLAVLLVAIAARGVVFRGYAASDDANYSVVAWELAEGRWPPVVAQAPPHYPMRLGVIAPLALLYRTFGLSETTLLVIPMAASLAMLLLVFFATRMWFGSRAGLIAAALYAIVPIDCRFATWLLTDIPGLFWTGLGIIVLYLGQRATRTRFKTAAGLLAGAAFGLSWLTRTQVAHMAPFVGLALVVWVFRDRRNLWLAVACAVVCAAVFVGEGLVYRATYGSFFYRLQTIERLYELDPNWYFKEGSPYGYERGRYLWGLLKRLFRDGPAAVLFNTNFGLLPLVALLASLHAAAFKERRFLFPALWFAYAALFFNFGSASLSHYEPLAWADPYITPLLLPSVILAGGWLAFMWPAKDQRPPERRLRRERRFWAGAAITIILMGSAWGLLQHVRQGVGCPNVRKFAAKLRRTSPLYTDRRSREAIRFFRGYPKGFDVRDFGGMRAELLPTGAHIFINPHQIRRARDLDNVLPPAWVLELAGRRTETWEGGDALIRKIAVRPSSAPDAGRRRGDSAGDGR